MTVIAYTMLVIFAGRTERTAALAPSSVLRPSPPEAPLCCPLPGAGVTVWNGCAMETVISPLQCHFKQQAHYDCQF